MEKSRTTCPAWCSREHPPGAAGSRVLSHDAIVAEHQTEAGDDITVNLTWYEHPNGQESPLPKVLLYAHTPGYTSTLELTADQADTLSDLLTLARAPHWLWKALARGAALLNDSTEVTR